MLKKIILIAFFNFLTFFTFSQKFKEIIPEENFTINLSLLSGSFAYEKKINKQITWYSNLGVGGSFVAGANGFAGTGSYSEFSFNPFFGSQVRYYLSSNNTNNKKQINKIFAGTYASFGGGFSTNSFTNPKYIDPRGGYGLGISVGRQIQKLSGWNFGYSIGYSLVSGYFEGPQNSNSSGFGFGLSIGYSLNM